MVSNSTWGPLDRIKALRAAGEGTAVLGLPMAAEPRCHGNNDHRHWTDVSPLGSRTATRNGLGLALRGRRTRGADGAVQGWPLAAARVSSE